MNETAIVCEINGTAIKVMIEKNCEESCHNCTEKKHTGLIPVHNSTQYEVKTGDRVEIYMSPGKTILAGFLVFIVPLLLFFVFYFIGRLIAGSENELIPALCGISGIGFGFLLNLGIKLIRKQQDLPEIIKVL